MAITTGPNPPEQPLDSSLSNQLQPPAPAPAPAATIANMQPALETGTPPITAESPNVRTHSFIARAASRLLDAIVGTPGPNYTVDAAGRTIAKAAPPMTTSQKLKWLANTVGEGLAAGSQVPQQKSGLAAALAGAGAGFGAEQAKEKGEDLLKRRQAAEDWEREQQATLHKHEIARQNALTLSTYMGMKKMANDMNPMFAQNESLFTAVKASPELGAHATEMSDSQVQQESQKNPEFASTHIVKPLGWAPEMDQNGNPVMVQDADGNQVPKMYMRMAVIDGTKEGKITVTPEMAADFKQYGPMARIPNAETIKAGDEYDLSSLLPALNKVDEQRKAVLDGWQHSELGEVTGLDGKPQYVEINKMIPPYDPSRTRTLTATPLAVKAEEAKSEQERAAAFKDIAEGKAKLAEAALTASLVGAGDKTAIPAYMEAIGKLPQSSQTILRNVPPAQQLALLKVANGDADLNKVFPTRTTKGSGQLDATHAATLVSLLNPSWTEGMYSTKQKAAQSFADGEDGKAIASFNQFAVHASDVLAASDRLKRLNSPWLNQPLNKLRTQGMGQPGVPGLMTAIQTARSEWQTFIKNGHAADLADTEQGRAIMNDVSSPLQIVDAIQEMGKTGIGRLDQIDAKWRRTWGGHYPGLISATGRQGFIDLGLGDMIKNYPQEGGVPMFGAQSLTDDVPPTGATGIAPGNNGKWYYHDAKGNVLGEAPAPRP